LDTSAGRRRHGGGGGVHGIPADLLDGASDLTQEWLGYSFHESFEVVIQSGAMLAVLVEYRRRFLRLADFRNHEGFSGLGAGAGWR
jgi:hypothetical protein